MTQSAESCLLLGRSWRRTHDAQTQRRHDQRPTHRHVDHHARAELGIGNPFQRRQTLHQVAVDQHVAGDVGAEGSWAGERQLHRRVGRTELATVPTPHPNGHAGTQTCPDQRSHEIHDAHGDIPPTRPQPSATTVHEIDNGRTASGIPARRLPCEGEPQPERGGRTRHLARRFWRPATRDPAPGRSGVSGPRGRAPVPVGRLGDHRAPGHHPAGRARCRERRTHHRRQRLRLPGLRDHVDRGPTSGRRLGTGRCRRGR